MSIGAPTRENTVGDRAYVVAPTTYTFQQKGRTMRETAQITIVLDKQAAGWKIASWTWTGPEQHPFPEAAWKRRTVTEPNGLRRIMCRGELRSR